MVDSKFAAIGKKAFTSQFIDKSTRIEVKLMTKQMLAALDLEIASEVEGDDWHSQGPLGIACLGWAEKRGLLPVKYDCWEGYLRLKKEQCVKIVRELMRLTADGRWCIVTVNGAAFDWRVLAEESGMKAECAELAMSHCDLTTMFLCKFGWPVGLAALAEGAGTFKAHSAVLCDGREVEIAGAMAPKLWKNGEREAVLGYMRQDCIATVTTAAVSLSRGYVGYVSKGGKPYRITLPTGPDGVYLPSLR
jgi:hypothetical protein